MNIITICDGIYFLELNDNEFHLHYIHSVNSIFLTNITTQNDHFYQTENKQMMRVTYETVDDDNRCCSPVVYIVVYRSN